MVEVARGFLQLSEITKIGNIDMIAEELDTITIGIPISPQIAVHLIAKWDPFLACNNEYKVTNVHPTEIAVELKKILS